VVTYVYAIVGAGHPLRLDDLGGVGDPARELRVLAAGPLAVVASDAPEGLRAKRRDLLSHQRVMDRLLRDGAVLPMRFGMVAPDDDQVVSAVTADADRYSARLTELDGCREYNVKVTRAEDDLLRQILEDVPEARRLSELARAQPADHARKVALGEVLANEARARQESDAREIAAGLEPRAVRRSGAEPTGSYFLNASFLVSGAKADEFTRAVEEEARRRGESYGFTLNGPLPPYSFV
jgi:hypothetical protein